MRWGLMVGIFSFGGMAFQVWLAVVVWGMPWYAAVLFALAVYVQGYLWGRGHGYRQGLYDNHTIYRDALRRVTGQFIEATPPQVGEAYTQLVTHRDRSN